AHSHGGNVALRALQHLNMADRIRVVTLATPFLRVFARRSSLPFAVEILVWGAIFTILMIPGISAGVGIVLILSSLFVSESAVLALAICIALAAGVASLFTARWLSAVFTNPHAALAIEEKASYDTKGAAAARMLVIRGVDDEASLSLAAGSIGSRLSYLVLVGAIPALVTMAMFLFFLSELFEWAVNVLL